MLICISIYLHHCQPIFHSWDSPPRPHGIKLSFWVLDLFDGFPPRPQGITPRSIPGSYRSIRSFAVHVPGPSIAPAGQSRPGFGHVVAVSRFPERQSVPEGFLSGQGPKCPASAYPLAYPCGYHLAYHLPCHWIGKPTGFPIFRCSSGPRLSAALSACRRLHRRRIVVSDLPAYAAASLIDNQSMRMDTQFPPPCP